MRHASNSPLEHLFHWGTNTMLFKKVSQPHYDLEVVAANDAHK
jgi:hypothetical protein